jgi:hypothetical protein
MKKCFKSLVNRRKFRLVSVNRLIGLSVGLSVSDSDDRSDILLFGLLTTLFYRGLRKDCISTEVVT